MSYNHRHVVEAFKDGRLKPACLSADRDIVYASLRIVDRLRGSGWGAYMKRAVGDGNAVVEFGFRRSDGFNGSGYLATREMILEDPQTAVEILDRAFRDRVEEIESALGIERWR